jgi:TetR/AcrR family transcriptional repressor of nem operon
MERAVRVSAEQKAETRQRIMDAAYALFRRGGIDGVGVDAVMSEAGLTHGGFYGHFASKEALAAEVCAERLARSAARWERIRQEDGAEAALARILDAYLDPAPIAGGDHGCVLPMLGPELARRPACRPALTAAMRAMADVLARCLPRRRRARERALAGLSCMVGAVVLARLADDREFAAELLAAARAEVGGRA